MSVETVGVYTAAELHELVVAGNVHRGALATLAVIIFSMLLMRATNADLSKK